MPILRHLRGEQSWYSPTALIKIRLLILKNRF